MATPTYSLLDLFFGPSAKRFEGTDLPKRPVTEFLGAVTVADSEIDGAIKVRVGVGADVTNDADDFVAIRSLVGNATTTNATPLEVVLDTMSANGAWAFDVFVTCRDTGAASNARVKLSALVTRIAGATSISTVSNDTIGSPGIAADLLVDGDDVVLELTGLGATTIRWGYEARIQKQGF